MDPGEPHWRLNSSFSPPLSRRWDCRLHSDGVSHGARRVSLYESSMSAYSKGSRRGINSNHNRNHHHSVSDGALSYHGSPSEGFPTQHWTPPAQRFDLGEFSTPVRGGQTETSVYSQGNEGHFPGATSSISSRFQSISPYSESGQWASTSKDPMFLAPRNSSGRRSFMSKPIYPLVYRNPISDYETSDVAEVSIDGKVPPTDSNRTSPESTLSTDLKFHKTLSELQKMEASPEPGASSMREGFRWSNASSYYDYGFEGDAIDIAEHASVDYSNSPNNPTTYQKCGLCERFLWQKSPWSSHRIVKNGDMPIAGVLPCSHVFHAECLEETTPKSQVHEPPCPVCLKAVTSEAALPFSEPLQVALRSVHGGLGTSNGEGSSSNPNPDREVGLKRNQTLPVPRRGGSLIKDHFKKRFSFKGKIGKQLFGPKVSGRDAPSSSSELPDSRNQFKRYRI